MNWGHAVSSQPLSTPDTQASIAAPDFFMQRVDASEPGMATLPFGPTYAATPAEAANYLPLPFDQKVSGWSSPNSFANTGNFMLAPDFSANDVHRSTSQPGNKRRIANPMEWSTARNNRDTLYAHEFLKAFRARMPDSAEGQAACDYCRKRKIKVSHFC